MVHNLFTIVYILFTIGKCKEKRKKEKRHLDK